MSYRNEMIEALRSGGVVDRYKESGNSMLPIIKSRQPVRIESIDNIELKENDIIFCKVHGNYYTHKILKIKGKQYQIGNNHGRINGWVTKDSIFGIVTKIYEL